MYKVLQTIRQGRSHCQGPRGGVGTIVSTPYTTAKMEGMTAKPVGSAYFPPLLLGTRSFLRQSGLVVILESCRGSSGFPRHT